MDPDLKPGIWNTLLLLEGLAAVPLLLLLAVAPEDAADGPLAIIAPLLLTTFTFHLAIAMSGNRAGIVVARAMLRRTVQEFVSYRFQLWARLGQLAVILALFYVLGTQIVRFLYAPLGAALDGRIPMNYMAYLFVALIGWPVLWTSYNAVLRGIRIEQLKGLFEFLMTTPRGSAAVPFGYLVSGLVMAIPGVLIALGMAVLILPDGSLHLAGPAAYVGFACTLTLGALAMWGLGVLLGGLTANYREIQPVARVTQILLVLFSGAYIPIALLPAWLQPVSRALPLTYAFDLLRDILGGGASALTQPRALLLLTLLAIGTMVAGTAAYRALLHKATVTGRLHGY